MVPVPFTGPVGDGDGGGGYAPGSFTRLYSACGSFTNLAANADTDLFLFTIPGGTFSAEGDTLKVQMYVKTLNTAETKVCRIFIGPNLQEMTITTANPEYNLRLDVIRETSQTRSRWYSLIARAITLSQSGLTLVTLVDWDIDNDFFVRIKSATAGNIEIFSISVDLIKAEA